MSEEQFFNGIDGTTGDFLMPPVTTEQVARLARGETWDPENLEDLNNWNDFFRENDHDVAFGIDHRNLAETGWGVVFAHETGEPVRRALAPLLEHRREQASRGGENYYRELTYRPRESKMEFLARHEAGAGPAHPDALPYYLLLVGSPGEIPFSFQCQLDVQYAVGRIHFETVEEYARYAESVVAVERGEIERARRATFFSVANRDDRATGRSHRTLAIPLADRLESREKPWTVERVYEAGATKAALGEILAEPPALLFASAHGMGFRRDDSRQLRHQGAILCQDWPGPHEWRGAIVEDHYFSADDLDASSSAAGLTAFFFACYGAGTPKHDSFRHRDAARGQIASESFVSRLAQRLLGQGALAVVSHVDRAWSYSYDWPRSGEQVRTFESALLRLANGYPVGAAMEYFNQRYAELSADLSYRIEAAKYEDEKPDLLSLSGLWTANNDARSYVVIGDPAVRPAVAEA